MTKLFERPEDLNEYLFRITDNGGATFDRYTVVFSDGSGYGLSTNPNSPAGFSQAVDGIDVAGLSERVDAGNEVDMALGDLEDHLIQHILSRENQGWKDYLASVEAKEPRAVAKTREEAQVNEGLMDSTGQGLYMSADCFMIRLDGEPADDLGPFKSAREALLATMPTPDSLAGSEYHSTITQVGSLEKTQGVAEAIAELENAVENETKPSF